MTTEPCPALSTTVFAGGCFWCVEGYFELLEGVTDAVSGYAGGTAETADYESVCSGTTDHAEAVQITFDPKQISFRQLLEVFFALHDPTQLNGQGPDLGRQYRSAVFYDSPDRMEETLLFMRELQQSGKYPRPLVTTLEPLTAFYPAEAYHQDYVRRNPHQPYVCAQALPKIDKLRKLFPHLLKK